MKKRRAFKACFHCNRLHRKCDNVRPCTNCIKYKKECFEYDNKGKKKDNTEKKIKVQWVDEDGNAEYEEEFNEDPPQLNPKLEPIYPVLDNNLNNQEKNIAPIIPISPIKTPLVSYNPPPQNYPSTSHNVFVPRNTKTSIGFLMNMEANHQQEAEYVYPHHTVQPHHPNHNNINYANHHNNNGMTQRNNIVEDRFKEGELLTNFLSLVHQFNENEVSPQQQPSPINNTNNIISAHPKNGLNTGNVGIVSVSPLNNHITNNINNNNSSNLNNSANITNNVDKYSNGNINLPTPTCLPNNNESIYQELDRLKKENESLKKRLEDKQSAPDGSNTGNDQKKEETHIELFLPSQAKMAGNLFYFVNWEKVQHDYEYNPQHEIILKISENLAQFFKTTPSKVNGTKIAEHIPKFSESKMQERALKLISLCNKEVNYIKVMGFIRDHEDIYVVETKRAIFCGDDGKPFFSFTLITSLAKASTDVLSDPNICYDFQPLD